MEGGARQETQGQDFGPRSMAQHAKTVDRSAMGIVATLF